MAGVRKRRRSDHDSTDRTMTAITQAQYLVGIYGEIVAMDRIILERVRQLIEEHADEPDAEPYVANLRLLLEQLEKVGERLAYWNSRARKLLEDQIAS